MSLVEKTLLSLKDMTFRTGVLHEAQISQLKIWGAALSPKSNSFEIKIDTNSGVVVYCFDKIKKNINIFKALNNSVKWLLGNEWTLKVADKKGIEKYVGESLVPFRVIDDDEVKDIVWRDKLK